ncbi:tetratricopeptide repeat protein [Nocardia huaxiensis]|uniref:tetratricopeptide repeat protein n=1 Tax=Nocardia huaxiensis TaxID=2755382 RepID=UPI001E4D0123|nr:tetratricopeptide repeat protein [Nocardia huaxiensis]UFS96588.1 hypothetical protein LPY97_01195 [Nocardia huaxiensis]
MSHCPTRLRARTHRTPALVVLTLIAVAAAIIGVAAVPDRHSTAAPAVSGPGAALAAQIETMRGQLDRMPGNAVRWADLGAAYVELARMTGDPSHYGAAQRALDRSLEVQPDGNADAFIGLGALKNALHDFGPAKTYAEKAITLRPTSADAYGVLVDALTQLGAADDATVAVQRMLDLRPGVTSFTRAAYDLELHGRTDEARTALGMALDAANTADQIAFCRYHLGELAFDSGQLDEAENQYRAGLLTVPTSAALRQGQAKVFAARGDTDRALALYAELTSDSALPQYLIEYGELLESAGRPAEAAARYQDVVAQFRALEAQGATDAVDAALLAAEHGDPTEAVRLAQLEYGRRQSVLTADVLAWALHRAGRDAEAIGYADQANSLGWQNASLAYHRGMILAALGRTDQAATALTDALRINPHFSPLHAPRAAQALDALTVR